MLKYVRQIKSEIYIDFFLVSGHYLFIGMWYIMSNYRGKLPKFVDFDVACVMVLEDHYSQILPITAQEGKIQTEDQFCDPHYYAIYDLSKKENSMSTQLSKLTTFANFECNR